MEAKTLSHTNELTRVLAELILAQQPGTPKKLHAVNLAEQIDALLREDQSELSQATAGSVRNRGPPQEAAAFTINEFCQRFRVSRSALYALWRAGRGPKIFRIGRSARISTDAAKEWVAEREAATVQTVTGDDDAA